MRGLLGYLDRRTGGHGANRLNVFHQRMDILVDVVSEDQLNVKSGESYRLLEVDPGPGGSLCSRTPTRSPAGCTACAAGASTKLIAPPRLSLLAFSSR